MRALADGQGCQTYATSLDGQAVIEMLGKQVRCAREDFAPALPLLTKLEYLWIERRIAAMVAAVPVDDPTKAPKAHEWDSQSLGEWMRRNVRTKGLYATLSIAVKTLCANIAPHPFTKRLAVPFMCFGR